jgi:diadenosine tetraphosphate (Ap4A) HIT family hydrolase
MPDPAPAGCLACDIVAGRVLPPGGVVARWPGFHLHAVVAPTPVRGWLVLTPERHVRGLYDLTDDEAARYAVLAARVQRAQREALGAAHVYAAVFAESLPHAHMHLIPRYDDTPERLRGPRVFLAGPEDALPDDAVKAAAAAVAARLAAAGLA